MRSECWRQTSIPCHGYLVTLLASAASVKCFVECLHGTGDSHRTGTGSARMRLPAHEPPERRSNASFRGEFGARYRDEDDRCDGHDAEQQRGLGGLTNCLTGICRVHWTLTCLEV